MNAIFLCYDVSHFICQTSRPSNIVDFSRVEQNLNVLNDWSISWFVCSLHIELRLHESMTWDSVSRTAPTCLCTSYSRSRSGDCYSFGWWHNSSRRMTGLAASRSAGFRQGPACARRCVSTSTPLAFWCTGGCGRSGAPRFLNRRLAAPIHRCWIWCLNIPFRFNISHLDVIYYLTSKFKPLILFVFNFPASWSSCLANWFDGLRPRPCEWGTGRCFSLCDLGFRVDACVRIVVFFSTIHYVLAAAQRFELFFILGCMV